MFGWLKRSPKRKPVESPAAFLQPAVRQWLRAKVDAAMTTPRNAEHWALADHLSADAAYDHATRKKVRDRARYEALNNPICRGIVRTHANSVIGTGPRLQVETENEALNAQIETAWKAWAKKIRLTDKLRTMRMAQCVDGETFALLVTSEDYQHVTLDVRPIECDQVTTPDLAQWNSHDVDGIELDPHGQPFKYHVLRRHPGDAFSAPTLHYDPVWASSIIHLYRQDRPGQHRALSELTPALGLFAVLRRYTHATLTSAEIAAAFSILLKTNAGAQVQPAELEAFQEIAYHHGGVATLPEGWDMTQLRAENPHTLYNEFKKAIIAEIARCLNMPYNVAAADSSGHSYASGRLDFQIYGTDVEIDQEHYGRECLDRIFAAWLQEAILARALPIDAVLAETAHAWQWDPLTDIDPSKTRSAQAQGLQTGLTSLPTEYARAGLDYRVEMGKQAKALGLTLADYQARVAAALLPNPAVAPSPALNAAEAPPIGEMGNLNRRQFTNNVKAIRDILNGVVDGSTPEFMALNLLMSIGLPEARARALVTDALDGQIDDPELAAAPPPLAGAAA